MSPNILIGCTGSVASIKLESLITEIKNNFKSNCNIKVVLTSAATNFLSLESLQVKVFWNFL